MNSNVFSGETQSPKGYGTKEGCRTKTVSRNRKVSFKFISLKI